MSWWQWVLVSAGIYLLVAFVTMRGVFVAADEENPSNDGRARRRYDPFRSSSRYGDPHSNETVAVFSGLIWPVVAGYLLFALIGSRILFRETPRQRKIRLDNVARERILRTRKLVREFGLPDGEEK